MSNLEKHALMSELQRFNQRKLSMGELMILSYCIGNSLPLIPDDVENPRMFVLGFSALIERIQYRLNEVTYIDNKDLEFIKENVTRMLLWRTAVSKGTLNICFSGENDVVIDEMSGMPRFFDVGVLCSVGDVVDRGNWLLNTFRNLVTFEKGCMENNAGGNNVLE